MYQVILATALATSAAAPNHCFSRFHCYSSCSCYAYACNGCHGGPYVNPVFGYGCAGGCYGYHGGCYGGFGVFTQESWYYGCTGCYGCYGGYSGYGVPVPMQPLNLKEQKSGDPFPPINPDAKKKPSEEVPLPKEKKKEVKNGNDGARGTLKITLPEGAKMFVDGQHINVAPGTHTLRTPVLTPGQTYYYDVRIEVMRDSGTIADERRVYVRPGEETAPVFANIPPPAANTAARNK